MKNILNGYNDFIKVNENGDWVLVPLEHTSVLNITTTQRNTIWYLPEGLDLDFFINSTITYPVKGFLHYVTQVCANYGYAVNIFTDNKITNDGCLYIKYDIMTKQGNVQFNNRLTNVSK